jgi:heat shock protein HspQ
MDRAHYFSAQAGRTIVAPRRVKARFAIGDVVKHRVFDFRGVIFDIDPVFANSEEWYEAIPEDIRPDRDQPFYHLLAESDDSDYVAYVSQQNLVMDSITGPVSHPDVHQYFEQFENGRYRMRRSMTH